MNQDERQSVWDDEDELRRMILEAEDNEVWRIEEAEAFDGDAPNSELLKLWARLNTAAAASEASDETE